MRGQSTRNGAARLPAGQRLRRSGGGGRASEEPPPAPTGRISLSLTDAPSEDVQALVLHIDGIALGHADGRAVHLGSFLYDFAYVPAGLYRIAFSCLGEWDEAEDDDYPSDPDGRFDFQVFSDPVEVMPGQMHAFDIVPSLHADESERRSTFRAGGLR